MIHFFQFILTHRQAPPQRDGITLLITVVLLSAILSVALGAFQIIYGQFLLTGEIQNSFDAFYAADQGIEKYLTLDRDDTPLAPTPDPCPSCVSAVLPSGACYEYIINKTEDTTIQVFGSHTCTLGRRLILRALQVSYPAITVTVSSTLTLSPSSTVLGLNGKGAIEPVYDPDGPFGSQLQQYFSATSLADVTFSSSNAQIVSVDDMGILTARAQGTAVITATYNSLNAQTQVKVAGKVESYTFQTPYPDRRTRSYLLYIPAQYSAANPTSLILVFHGGGGNGQSMMDNSLLNILADQEGFLVAYPNGTGILPEVNTWNVGSCCAYAQENEVDDVTFVSMLIDDIAERFTIDQKKVYATGLSNGAMMSHRLACQLADKIAAIAPIGGGLNFGGDFTSCSPSRKISVLNFHGTTDDNYLYYCDAPEGCRGPDAGDENQLRVSIPSVVHDWVVRNSIPETSKQITYQNGIETCEMYSSPTQDVEVGLCTARPTQPVKVGQIVYDGGGHAMPGGIRNPGSANADVPTQDISANATMWEFFEKHPEFP